ncbi:hypothetical protein BDC45DRAFT_590550 [Circinella umbellata]|nr:hypothetical protein BDC45DRAFT_590550 [Circinella umbellata]
MHILKISRSLSLGPLLVIDCDITQLETLLNQKYLTPELSESSNSYIQRMTIWYTRSLIGYAALRDKAASASSLTVCRLHLESVVETCEIDRTATTLLSNPCSNLLDLSDRISVGLVSFCDYHLGLSKEELGYLKNQVTTWLHIFIRMTLSLAYARNLVNEYDNDYIIFTADEALCIIDEFRKKSDFGTLSHCHPYNEFPNNIEYIAVNTNSLNQIFSPSYFRLRLYRLDQCATFIPFSGLNKAMIFCLRIMKIM